MKRFSLRLTEAEYVKLRNHCEELHISMNDVVRQLIREWEPNQQMPIQSRNKENSQNGSSEARVK